MNRIKELREERRLSQERLAASARTSRQQIDRLEKGQRGLDQKWMVRLAKALDVPVAALFDESASPSFATLIGAVGAGETIAPYGKDATFERLPAPPGLGFAKAVVVRGDSMLPVYRDGDVLVFEYAKGVSDSALGRDCVCELADGTLYLKILQRGSRKGRWNLLSYNPHRAPMADLKLAWAATVSWVKRG